MFLTLSEKRIKKKQGSGYVTMISLVATLGGLLFGYDTAVISGAVGSLKTYFVLSSAQMGWAASSALVGCVLGAMFAGKLSNIGGRKVSLIIAAILFLISAIGTALPQSFSVFIIFRIVGGVGVGVASMLSPMYIAEVAPSHLRGKLVSYNQFAIIFGMLVVYFVNYFIALQGDVEWNIQIGWRWMFASEAVPATIFLFLLFLVSESPRWLVMKGRKAEAKATLERINTSEEEAVGQLSAIEKSFEQSADTKINLNALWTPGVRAALFVGIALSFFQQVTGINVFLYYAPVIFEKMGSETNAALLQTIIVGIANLTFTIIAILTVDKYGRKPLMFIGSLGMGVCMLTIGVAAYFQNTDIWLLVFILGYISFFAMSLGPVTWVLLSEIFPNRVRSIALSIAVAVQWISNFVVSQTFPMMMDNEALDAQFHGAFPFWVYGIMGLISAVFIILKVPETKGKSLEEMEKVWEHTAKGEK